MLTVTENARSVIRDIVSHPEAPEGAQLRIAPAPEQNALTLAVVPEAASGDQVVDDVVCVDAQLAMFLEQQTLDAVVEPDGSARFMLVDTPAEG